MTEVIIGGIIIMVVLTLILSVLIDAKAVKKAIANKWVYNVGLIISFIALLVFEAYDKFHGGY